MRDEPCDVEQMRQDLQRRLADNYERYYQMFCAHHRLDPESIDAVLAYEEEIEYELERSK